MAYPTSLDTLTTGIGTTGQPLSNPNHITQHTNESTAIQALETKVGIDSSADTTTIDYKLKNTSSVDPGHKHSTSSISGQIAVAQGGTGVTASTGTVAVVLSTSPTLVTPLLGTPTSGNLVNCSFPTFNQDTTGKSAKTDALNSATTVVNVSSAIAPSSGQALVATSSTAATWQTLSGVYKNGTTTRDAAASSGTQTIAHGVGLTPKSVTIKAIFQTATGLLYTAECFYNGTTQSSISAYSPSAGSFSFDNTFTIAGTGSSGTTVGVVTVDATNISIAWTKSSSPSGVYQILWQAIY